MDSKIIHLLFSLLFIVLSGCKSNSLEYGNRLISKTKLKEAISFQHSTGHVIRLWSDNNHIYLSDAPAFQVPVYNMQGKLIRILGKKGPAPWENGTIWHFSLTTDHKFYWIQDYQKQLVKKYDFVQDTLISYNRIITINNVQFIGNGKFLVPRIDDKTGMFILSIFDTKNNIYKANFNIGDSLNLDKSDKYQDFLLQGNFARDNNSGMVIYYCYYAGLVILINTDINDIHILKDFRNFPLPKIIVRNGEKHFVPKHLSSISGAIGDNKMDLLSVKYPDRGIRNNSYYIDSYEIPSGKYLYSIPVPRKHGEVPLSISKTSKGYIIGYMNGSIVNYKLTDN